ncbi:MAG TPA: hypothetical protein VI958_05700 [Acidobacteriota bacterium]
MKLNVLSEGVVPSTFNADKYYSANLDVWRAFQVDDYGMSPEAYAEYHYLTFGIAERRPLQIVLPSGFSGKTYLSYNADVLNAFLANNLGWDMETYGREHYLRFGFREDRRYQSAVTTTATVTAAVFAPSPAQVTTVVSAPPPAPVRTVVSTSPVIPSMENAMDIIPIGFNATDYFAANPDVALAFATNNYGLSKEEFARVHYIKYGIAEKRLIRPRVTTQTVLTPNPAISPLIPTLPDTFFTTSTGTTPTQTFAGMSAQNILLIGGGLLALLFFMRK